MHETLLPKLEDPKSRQAVLEVVLVLLGRWGIDEVDQCKLLGVNKLSDLHSGEPSFDETFVFTRIGYILAIERELSRLYPYQAEKHDRWLIEPQDLLEGKTPLTMILDQGIEAMRHIKHVLESQYMEF
jgi:hypothetical protein